MQEAQNGTSHFITSHPPRAQPIPHSHSFDISLSLRLLLLNLSISQKCDGARPVCGQCTAKRRPDDCEYTTGQGLTRSQMLEENIALLETRIRELENRDTSAPSVRLMAAPQAPPMSPTTAAAALEASEASGASGKSFENMIFLNE